MKKLDIYVLKRFLVLFMMTFFICIFILLMQFLWLHVKDLVGKGLPLPILAEFFFYAAFTMVPLGLPLAILLASLMTFGNLGESFELTAMKAAGISLFRIMRPLIVFIAMVCVGAFYFSNFMLPVAQTKLYALLFSLKQKSPELDIPVGEFYSGIDGYNVYVRKRDGKWLNDLMIYDFSSGGEATVMTADSGFIQASADNKYLLLTLYSGESFENITEQGKKSTGDNIPYRREEFKRKEMLIEFDSELNRYDESLVQDQHISKNVYQLLQSIDSVKQEVDVKVQQQSNDLISRHFLGRENIRTSPQKPNNRKASPTLVEGEEAIGGDIMEEEDYESMEIEDKENLFALEKYNLDSLIFSQSPSNLAQSANQALAKAKEKKEQITYNKIMVDSSIRYIRRHKIELHRKFTLSFACLIFFFIGAPLGAIIRKGGLGLPAVISVLMFIVYYIIDNTGYKMAREGVWEVYQGIWLSSAILLPIGIFLTYKAAVDAALFNSDQYKKFFHNISSKIKAVFQKNRSRRKKLNIQELN